jgi:alpha-L-arabinofuranosidase
MYASEDASFYQQLAALKPGTLRYPGGTGANFFQWKAGLSVNPRPDRASRPPQAGRSGSRCRTW